MSIYEHYHKDEYEYIDQVLDWKSQVLEQYAYKLTDFLNPREQNILTDIIGKGDEIGVSFWGGCETVERKRAIIYPSYYDVSKSDFMCVCFSINYPEKFLSIQHKHVLGSLMGLGVKREKFGDVIVSGKTVQFVIDKKISDYVKYNFTKVGKASVKLVEISEEELMLEEETWQEKSITVASLRMDAVLADTFNVSRQKINPLIKAGNAKVNWKVVEQPSYECVENDILSVRGFGRCKIINVSGKTKKDKWKLTVGLKK
jgi:RNA-binding protein YlmH